MQLNLLGHNAPLNGGMEFSMHSPVSLVGSRPSHWVLFVPLLSEQPCLSHFGSETALIRGGLGDFTVALEVYT